MNLPLLLRRANAAGKKCGRRAARRFAMARPYTIFFCLWLVLPTDFLPWWGRGAAIALALCAFLRADWHMSHGKAWERAADRTVGVIRTIYAVQRSELDAEARRRGIDRRFS